MIVAVMSVMSTFLIVTPDCLHHIGLLSGQHHKVGEVVGDLQNIEIQNSGRRELVTVPWIHLISEVSELIRRDLVRSLRVPQVLYRLPGLIRGVEGVEALDVALLLGGVKRRRLELETKLAEYYPKFYGECPY